MGPCRTYRLKGFGPLCRWYCVITRERFILVRYANSGHPVGVSSGPWVSPDGQDQKDQLGDEVTRLMKRRVKEGAPPRALPHADYGDLLESMPNFAAWMTDAVFEDGVARKGGWMSVYCAGGMWRATLSDSAEKLILFLSAPTWTELLTLIEHATADPDAPWRPDDRPQPGEKKKSK